MDINLLILTIVAMIPFCIMYEIVYKYDHDSYYKISSSEAMSIAIMMFIIAIISYLSNKTLFGQILSSLFLGVLAYNAVCDSKTKEVYRFFNIINIIVGIVYFVYTFAINANLLDAADKIIFFGGIIFFDFIIILFASGVIKRFSVMGMGDTLALIATSLYLPCMTISNKKFFSLEILLYHYIFSIAFLFFFNIKYFLNKKLRAKEKIAFLPDIIGGILAIFCIFV